MNPRYENIFTSAPALLIGRILLSFMFWMSGLEKITNWSGTMAEMRHFNLSPAPLFSALTIITLILAPLLFLFRNFIWLGAGWMAVFTLLTIPVAHPFWNLHGEARLAEVRTVMEHVSIVGGLFLAVALAAIVERRDRSRAPNS